MPNFGLIGHPLSHSFSPDYFGKKFQKLGLSDYQYLLYDFETLPDLRQWIASETSLIGINVTIPYKREVIPFLHEVSTEESAIGAVNCIKIIRSAESVKLYGENTDWLGFTQSLFPLLHQTHKRALIFGNGATSQTVAYSLKHLGIEYLKVARNPNEGELHFSELSPEHIHSNQLLINTTSLGMHPKLEGFPPIPYEHIGGQHVLFDVVYNPEETLFLKLGKARGATIKNGLEMLHLQAEGAWKFWHS